MASPHLEEKVSSEDEDSDVGIGVRPSFSNRLRSSLSNAWTSFRGAFTWRSRRRVSDPLGRSRRSLSDPLGRSRRSRFDESFDESFDENVHSYESFDEYVHNYECFDTISDPLESLGLEKSASSSSSSSSRSDATSQYITLDVDGGFHDISEFGVLIHYPPNTVAHPTKVTFKKHPSVHFRPAPAEETETLVSYIVELAPSSLVLQEPIIVSLMHSGAGKTEGYETIMKAFDDNKHKWKQIKEIQGHYFPPENCKTDHIQIKISKPTTLAVVSRLITDEFQVTEKGCFVWSSVCNAVTVEFPKGAVDKTVNGTMKLLPMPVNIDTGTTSYPGPILLIDGFQGVCFKHNVKIRVPHPYPAGYSTGKIQLFCKEDTKQTSHEWKDITDQVQYLEDELFIELQVDHFSWLWTWIYDVSLTVVSSLSQYLFIAPQAVRFAAFKKAEECSSEFLTITLVCIPNHEPIEKTAAMKAEGYARLAMSTANKNMRPNDKAYIKVEGSYRKTTKEEFFLQFLRNEMCIKELNLQRKSNRKRNRSKRDGELVIYFLEKENIDMKGYLCKFCIYQKKLTLNKSEEESCSEVKVVETGGLKGAPPGPSERSSPAATKKDFAPGDHLCQDLVLCFGDTSIINSIDADTAANKVAHLLNLNKLSMMDPPDDLVKKCRYFCACLKKEERGDIVKELRKLLPNGMTGPLCDGETLVKDMDSRSKQRLSRALAVKVEWKAFAEKAGVSRDDIEYYDNREKNPVLSILEEHCGNITVDQLYILIVESGANAIADYL